ncbi:NADPH-dependent FMN reductase ArsH [Porphyridium purpureum]|uniref:NADPH-dependent FMN reductase ArsH n=1 Tax=Porphyridium purpureum TaxID=35688 RepID=A0A5J4YXS0_PORPP|nr:NADPH-dependent FMN reductase ArsH [Porphyridium purpureum]|eukprot:POR8832..scf209_3
MSAIAFAGQCGCGGIQRIVSASSRRLSVHPALRKGVKTAAVLTGVPVVSGARTSPVGIFARHSYHQQGRGRDRRGFSVMGSAGVNMSSDLFSNENPEAFADLNHPGYALASDPVTHAGGWLAHRAAQEPVDGVRPHCWVRDEVADYLTRFDYAALPIGRPPRILVLYGSLRPSSFSRKMAYEFARLLDVLGCDVRVYNPQGLPPRDPELENEIKVRELRALTLWSDGHVWVSPEMHGTITGVFKNQIDWIPLNTGSVRPTQGRTALVAQVNGGSQSFNAVNALRLLARWMRMPCCTNQSSVAKAWTEFDDAGRMKESDFRDRAVDCAEEFAKFTAVMTPVAGDLTNRYSERKEKLKNEGKLLTQAEKEQRKAEERMKALQQQSVAATDKK